MPPQGALQSDDDDDDDDDDDPHGDEESLADVIQLQALQRLRAAKC
jgi:hypothetical protein